MVYFKYNINRGIPTLTLEMCSSEVQMADLPKCKEKKKYQTPARMKLSNHIINLNLGKVYVLKLSNLKLVFV